MSAIQEWIRGVDLQYVIQRLMLAVAAVISICVHESSHGLAALWLGDDTAKRLGRISMNPLRHLDVAGLIMMVLVGFGWAKPVPIDMRRFEKPKVGMALTALAGPVSNILLAFFAIPLWYLSMLLYARSVAAPFWNYFGMFLSLFISLNAGLAVFNLLPISPLDGSKILAIALPQAWYFKLMRIERYGMFILIALLFTGVLDRPLIFLRSGLITVLEFIWTPLRHLILTF